MGDAFIEVDQRTLPSLQRVVTLKLASDVGSEDGRYWVAIWASAVEHLIVHTDQKSGPVFTQVVPWLCAYPLSSDARSEFTDIRLYAVCVDHESWIVERWLLGLNESHGVAILPKTGLSLHDTTDSGESFLPLVFGGADENEIGALAIEALKALEKLAGYAVIPR